MNKSIICYGIRRLAAGWIGAMGVILAGQAALAGPASVPQMTVYIYNSAKVEPATLREAKDVAARVFRNAGLDAVLLDPPSLSDEGNGPADEMASPTVFFVHILTPAMAKRLHLRATVMGVAPGTSKEKNRSMVYVFDHVATQMAREQMEERVDNIISFSADKGQILGYGIAHEIGHVLLNLDAHSPRGIMQARWDRYALADIAGGRLSFGPQEVATIQAEVARRGMQQ